MNDSFTVKPARYVLSLLALTILSSLLLGVISVAERLLLVHGSTYPRWLASGSFDSLSPEMMSRLRKTYCDATGVEVMEKPNQWVFRCGDFLPGSKTFLVARSPANDQLVNSPTTFE